MKVTILGAGAFGMALGEVLDTNGHEVNYYDPVKFPERTLPEAIVGAEALVMATPTSVVPELLPNLPRELPLVLASKGFLTVEPFAEFPQFAVISGGAFAADLLSKDLVTLTGTSQVVYDLFNNNSVTIELSSDVRGVLICGSLKNVYAIGAGLLDLDRHTEEFNKYTGNVLSELYQILRANNCDEATANKSCGIMDLIITSTPASRNFSYGRELARNPHLAQDPKVTTEGITAIRQMKETPGFVKPEGVPILDQIIARVEKALDGAE